MTSTEPRTDIFEHRADEPVSEQLLLAAARDGSTGAFGILYARHREHAVSVARRALPAGDGALAEDVAESAFIDVFTALRNGKGPTDTLRFYLVTAVRRQAWRVQRRQRRQSESLDRWSVELAATRSSDAAAASSAADADLGGHLVLTEAFRSLSPRWRHVLWLTEVEGRKAAEIAPLLGLSSGSASALAYRARQGLVAAYLAACAPHRSDPACAALTSRLAAFLSAGRATDGFADVEAHLEGCPSCRDLSRGVDLAGTTLGAAAPFGLLTLGWWAKSVAAGAGAKAGAALGGATAAAASGAAAGGAASGGATAGSSAVGMGAAAAAVVAAVVVAGAAALGWGGGGGGEAASAPARAEVAGTSVEAPPTDPPSAPPGPSPTSSAPAPLAPASEAPLAPPSVDAAVEPTVPALLPVDPPARAVPPTTPAPTATPSPTTAVPTTTSTVVATTLATTTSSLVTSTTAVATTAVTTTSATSTTQAETTTTEPEPEPPGTGVLSGRIVVAGSAAPGEETGVEDVRIVLVRPFGGPGTEARTGPDGRWRVPRLASGRYLVVAEVPSAYAPQAGLDPWLGGPTWTAVLGVVELDRGSIDLVDLRLVPR